MFAAIRLGTLYLQVLHVKNDIEVGNIIIKNKESDLIVNTRIIKLSIDALYSVASLSILSPSISFSRMGRYCIRVGHLHGKKLRSRLDIAADQRELGCESGNLNTYSLLGFDTLLGRSLPKFRRNLTVFILRLKSRPDSTTPHQVCVIVTAHRASHLT